jgi:hypothetical protein
VHVDVDKVTTQRKVLVETLRSLHGADAFLLKRERNTEVLAGARDVARIFEETTAKKSEHAKVSKNIHLFRKNFPRRHAEIHTIENDRLNVAQLEGRLVREW